MSLLWQLEAGGNGQVAVTVVDRVVVTVTVGHVHDGIHLGEEASVGRQLGRLALRVREEEEVTVGTLVESNSEGVGRLEHHVPFGR